MNQFLQKNIQVLEQVNPRLAGFVKARVQVALPKVEKDPQGNLNIRIQNGDWLYPPHLKSQLEEWKTAIAKEKNPQIIVMMGFGLGVHLEAYLKSPHPKNQFVLIVEPDIDLFVAFLSLLDATQLFSSPRFVWLVGERGDDLRGAVSKLYTHLEFAACIKNSVLISWGYQNPDLAIFEAEWKELVFYVESTMQVTYLDSYYGFRNFLMNYKEVIDRPLLEHFKDAFKGKPGLLISSGPSLNTTLEQAKPHLDKFVTFAVGSALSILKEKSVKVPMSGCLERVPSMAMAFDNVDTTDNYLITTPIIYPTVYKAHKGKKIHMVRGHHFLPWLFDVNFYSHDFMATASHLGLFVLHFLGCSPIYILGQDLAADPDSNKTHAKGYMIELEQDQLKNSGENFVSAMDHFGNPRETRALWYQYALMFRSLVLGHKIRAFNVLPKKYGIKIDAVPQINPEEVFNDQLKSLESLNVSKTLDDLYKKFEKDRETVQKFDRSRITRSREELKRLVQKSSMLKQEILEFYASTPLDRPDDNLVERYHSFFRYLAEQTDAMMNSFVWVEFLNQILFLGQLYEHIQKSYEIISHDDHDPETLMDKLSIPMQWFADIVIRGNMILRLIDKIPT